MREVFEKVLAAVNILAVIGLCLDLLGVFLLGFDLIRVQAIMQQQARVRVRELEQLSEIFHDLPGGVQEAASRHAYSNFNYDEGLRVPSYEGVDVESAQRVVDATSDAVSAMHAYADQMTELTAAMLRDNESGAKSSLAYSYAGLILIFVGFGLQIWGAVRPLG